MIGNEFSRRTLLGALVVGAGACAGTPLPLPDATGSVAVNGLAVSYRRRGSTRPLVVFDSGLGDGMDVWDGVIAALPAERAIFAYSRPGYGESAPLADPELTRTSEQAARHLANILTALDERRPLVLVGHSLGGLYIAKFAAMYPRSVAGLVFVDGRPPDFRAACQTNGLSFCDGSRNAEPPPTWPEHIKAEMRGLGETEAMAPAASELAAIPATVITSTNEWPGEGGDEGFALWLQSQARFAEGFRDHRLVHAEGAGHYVQREQPALVAAEIEALIQRLR